MLPLAGRPNFSVSYNCQAELALPVNHDQMNQPIPFIRESLHWFVKTIIG